MTQKTRGDKLKLIYKFIVRQIAMEDILAGVPSIALAFVSIGLAMSLFKDPTLVDKFAELRYCAMYEIVSVLIFQYMLFVFDPVPQEAATTPVWLRVAAIFVIPLFLVGLKASFFIFKKIFIYFWPFITAKAVTLYLRRPSEKDRSVGCLGATIGLVFLLLMCGAAAALEAGPAWYLVAGFPYFALLGAYEIISEPLYKLPDYKYWDSNEE